MLVAVESFIARLIYGPAGIFSRNKEQIWCGGCETETIVISYFIRSQAFTGSQSGQRHCTPASFFSTLFRTPL